MGLANAKEIETDSINQWDILTGFLAFETAGTWGISTTHIPRLIQLMKDKKIARFKAGEDTISFANLKKLVAYLYAQGFDTADLYRATETFVNRERIEEPEPAGNERKELYSHIQAWLHRFEGLVPLPLNTDGIWHPASQHAWETVQKFFNIREELPLEQILPPLESIVERRPAFICSDTSATRFLRHANFAESVFEGSNFKLSLTGTTGSLQKARKEIIHFPDLSVNDPAPFDAFAACLLVLQLHAKKPPDDFCDLLLLKDQENWQTLHEFPCSNKHDFYFTPEHGLNFQERDKVAFTIRYIPKADYSIEVIGFYLSGNFTMAATIGYDINDEEFGKEKLFDAELFFREYNTDSGNNEVAVFAKADYIKFFIVRKNRKKYAEKVSYQPSGYALPLEFYQLITTDEEDILATVCFGLDFTASPARKGGFRENVRSLYKNRPIHFEDDLQKGRWGGKNFTAGKELQATVKPHIVPGLYTVNIVLQLYNTSCRQAAIFLHDSFKNQLNFVSFTGGIAGLKATAYEAFTVGAYTDDNTMLELDLNEVYGFPRGFYYSDISEAFKTAVEKIYASNPFTVADDLQKNRWGGKVASAGKQISARVSGSLITGYYSLTVEVTSSGTHQPLMGDVAFFLHDSFPHEIKYKKAIEGVAKITLTTYEAFTVGAYTQDGTMLELDLQQQKGFPAGFYYKEESNFEKPLRGFPYLSIKSEQEKAAFDHSTAL